MCSVVCRKVRKTQHQSAHTLPASTSFAPTLQTTVMGGQWDVAQHCWVLIQPALPHFQQWVWWDPGWGLPMLQNSFRLWQMDRLCSRDTWAGEAGDTPWPRPWRLLVEFSAKFLASTQHQRSSGMGWWDCWRPRPGLVGREEEQELAQAIPCSAGCVIRHTCLSLLLPIRRAKIHQTIWKEPLKNLVHQQQEFVWLGRRLSYTLTTIDTCLWGAGRMPSSCFPSEKVAQQHQQMSTRDKGWWIFLIYVYTHTQTLSSYPQPITIPIFINPSQLTTEEHLIPIEALAWMLPYADTYRDTLS